jgi:hypothetical protein
VILRWNFSGTPWGGVWLLPGHTMSFISSPSFSHDFQTPICEQRARRYVKGRGELSCGNQINLYIYIRYGRRAKAPQGMYRVPFYEEVSKPSALFSQFHTVWGHFVPRLYVRMILRFRFAWTDVSSRKFVMSWQTSWFENIFCPLYCIEIFIWCLTKLQKVHQKCLESFEM